MFPFIVKFFTDEGAFLRLGSVLLTGIGQLAANGSLSGIVGEHGAAVGAAIALVGVITSTQAAPVEK